MFTKLTNMICKQHYTLYKVKLDSQFFSFTRIPTQRHLCHASTASLMTLCSKPCQTSIKRCFPVPDMTYNVFGGTLSLFTQSTIKRCFSSSTSWTS